MDAKEKKTIGILGGMGPEATSLFFQKIIRFTPARKDQDHLKVIIYNDPGIPDRTASILSNQESPVSRAKAGLKHLEKCGSDFIVIPCVTIHFYYEELKKSISTPILNIIEESAMHVKTKFPGTKRIGILATRGTFAGEIFQKVFHEHGLVSVIPEKKSQDDLMESIYGTDGIKAGFSAGRPKELIINVVNELIRNGAEAIIGGCTEIPIAVDEKNLNVPFVDILSVLACSAISYAGVKPKRF